MISYPVLIVDDSSTQLGLHSFFPLHPAYNPIAVNSLEQVQSTLEKEPVFMVIVKWELVSQNEGQWMKDLRNDSRWKSIPIFVIADSISLEDRINVFYYGANELFVSPFQPEELFFRLVTYFVTQLAEEAKDKSLRKTREFAAFYADLNSLDPKLICQKMLDFANDVLKISWSSVWWFDKKNQALVLGVHSYREFPVQSVPYQPDNFMWQALEQNRHLLFESSDTSSTDADSDNLRKGLAMVVPLVADEVKLGVVNFTNFSNAFFENYELKDLLVLCGHVISRLGYALNHQKVLMQEKELEESNQKLEGLNEELKHLLDIQQDISSNLMETSRELSESKQKLEKLHRLKDDFLAIASHDLRSPLSGIQLAVNTILEYYEVEEDVQELLHPVLGLCEDNLAMISDLLDIAKIESGQSDLELVELNPDVLKQSFQELRSYYEILAKGKGIELLLKFQDPLPVVAIDLPKVKQVLNNLIGNAIKFTPEHGTIAILAGMEEDYLKITVHDSGVGIKSEDLTKVFNKYEQVKERKVGTKGEKGTGLGLAICKNLVEEHGGKIWVESEVGHGSQFHFTIPTMRAN